ncbi:MAG: FMN-binding protein [bacterium]|nr:FMN-binding protein [bacterium]
MTDAKNARSSTTAASVIRLVAPYLIVILAGSALASTAYGDEIELKGGTIYKGKLIEEKHDSVVFQADIGGTKVELNFPIAKVQAVTVKGVRRMVKPGKKPTPKGPLNPSDIPKNDRSESEVDDLVENVGRSKPKWYDSVPLRFPPTLRLNWQIASRGYKPHVNLRQYIDSIITPAPDKWKEGVRLMHHTLGVNRTNSILLKRSQKTLADMYFNFFGDYARAAYQYRQAGGRNHVPLATCYFRLGCKKLAVKILSELHDDNTPDGSVIRLWSEMNELDKALYYAERAARAGRPDVAYLAAGDACRRDGQYNKALGFYQKVVDAEKGSAYIKRNSARAAVNLEAVKLQTTLRLAKVPNGTYRAKALGYQKNSPINVSVTVADGTITSLRVVEIRDKRFFSSLSEMPKRIMATQKFLAPPKADTSIKVRYRTGVVIKEEPGTVVQWLAFKGLDTISGATQSSQGIFNATIKALGEAQSGKKE